MARDLGQDIEGQRGSQSRGSRVAAQAKAEPGLIYSSELSEARLS